MKNSSKRNGKVATFDGSALGLNRVGKGDFPRFNYQVDEKYKKNYNKIDWSK